MGRHGPRGRSSRRLALEGHFGAIRRSSVQLAKGGVGVRPRLSQATSKHRRRPVPMSPVWPEIASV